MFAEPDLTFVAAVKMVQSWETPESNAKDLQRLQQGPNMMVNKTAQLMPTTKPSQDAIVNSNGVSINFNTVTDNIYHI